jgi:hypothetical protein
MPRFHKHLIYCTVQHLHFLQQQWLIRHKSTVSSAADVCTESFYFLCLLESDYNDTKKESTNTHCERVAEENSIPCCSTATICELFFVFTLCCYSLTDMWRPRLLSAQESTTELPIQLFMKFWQSIFDKQKKEQFNPNRLIHLQIASEVHTMKTCR